MGCELMVGALRSHLSQNVYSGGRISIHQR